MTNLCVKRILLLVNFREVHNSDAHSDFNHVVGGPAGREASIDVLPIVARLDLRGGKHSVK